MDTEKLERLINAAKRFVRSASAMSRRSGPSVFPAYDASALNDAIFQAEVELERLRKEDSANTAHA